MARKRNRRKLRTQYSDAKVTPTHFVRLERLRVIVDADRSWYVLRIDGSREKTIRKGLEAAGFAVCSPTHTSIVENAGRYRELRQRAVPGYLFVGVKSGINGRSALWSYHDSAIARPNSGSLSVIQQHHCDLDPCHGQVMRPFYRVLGPFASDQLQRFCEKVGGRITAVLYENHNPIAQFPPQEAKILEGERIYLYDKFRSKKIIE